MEVIISVEILILLLTFTIALLAYQLTRTQPRKTINPRNRRPIDILYDPEDDPDNPKRVTVDIVAVHSLDGLGSNVDGPWTWSSGQPKEPVHWLRDSNMLRRKIPTARIMTFNYDSTWITNAPQTRVELHGEDLIRSLHNIRQDKQRPVVFVAHGFGGLVVQECEQGLIFALCDTEFEDILHSTAGFVSLGTPFRGINIHWAADLIARVMWCFGSNRGMLSVLAYDNPQLRDKVQRLPFRLNFFKAIVVAEASACVPGDERVPLQADHHELSQYSGPENRLYLSVSTAIVKMCEDASTVTNGQHHGDGPPPMGNWMVPFERKGGFVGHQGFLDGHLERTTPNCMKYGGQKTGIEGFDGVGKTHIALQVNLQP
ncbi:unnamed protein product [Fusarium venenatum]|uniref:DUF676 domain-containing protein n=1 Tax=Fusarium venenatum TaxID=56646 RepID=A0A2L2SRR6_9HYPO|nr:uncharacterized protein FVRRES_12581 [Fusarium venenatum]CEI39890.1 unnamed protein product [Fusarium venenatum]